MKATPSNVGGKIKARNSFLKVTISMWEEDTFAVPVTAPAAPRRDLGDFSDWENIEAIGAADDAARFKPDLQLVEADSLHP